jgi:hypothetical protein
VLYACVLKICEAQTQVMLVGEIAQVANQKLEREGERVRLSAKAVGTILRRLGIKTECIGSRGRGIWITREHVQKITNLSRDYGVIAIPPPPTISETQKGQAGGKEPGKKPAMSKDRRARQRKKRA